MTASPELRAASYDPDYPNCDRAVRCDREACAEHYVPTHRRPDPRACSTCSGRKRPRADTCARCRGAAVR